MGISKVRAHDANEFCGFTGLIWTPADPKTTVLTYPTIDVPLFSRRISEPSLPPPCAAICHPPPWEVVP